MTRHLVIFSLLFVFGFVVLSSAEARKGRRARKKSQQSTVIVGNCHDEDCTTSDTAAETATDWSHQQIEKFPASEKPVSLFNGRDFTGWEGHIDPYWSVQDGVIVARNEKENAPKVSTYLLTDKKYRNFRLVFESKLVESEMHSGISLWGKKLDIDGEPFSYQGHLVMYPSGYGFWDLYRRNSIYQDKDQVARKAGRQHEWNQMEILAIGDRIRHVINGKLVADWTDPQPELCGTGPIGLQLHSNSVPQEVHFRGLVLSEDPEDKLITVVAEPVEKQE